MPPGGQRTIGRHVVISLCAACTGCITRALQVRRSASSLPRRCLHGVHPKRRRQQHHDPRPLPRRCLHGVHPRGMQTASLHKKLCLGAACTGCILYTAEEIAAAGFASALPARGASFLSREGAFFVRLCLGAACTGCIFSATTEYFPVSPLPRRCLHGVHPDYDTVCGQFYSFASALPARGASAKADKLRHTIL